MSKDIKSQVLEEIWRNETLMSKQSFKEEFGLIVDKVINLTIKKYKEKIIQKIKKKIKQEGLKNPSLAGVNPIIEVLQTILKEVNEK